MKTEKQLRDEIATRVQAVYQLRKKHDAFSPGHSKIHYAGRVYDEKEMLSLVDSALDFWLTLGPKGIAFEVAFAKFIGRKKAVVVNSGSSAILLAVASLCANTTPDKLEPGDEVITAAMSFPSTIAAILHNNLVPVFLDCEIDTYNVDPKQIEVAITRKTRAIVVTHTLGNPCDMDAIAKIAKKHKLYLVEDTCDALDSKFAGKMCGTFGDTAAVSFYPAHHMTMGEGGIVVMDDPYLYRSCMSLRDWGRDCWCHTGETHPLGACHKRFSFHFPPLPKGYDHKYTYTNIGYNLKPTDLQCAIGLEQLKKVPSFTKKRQKNFAIVYNALKKYEDYLILPRALPKADPSWFGFPITLRDKTPFAREDIIDYLENHNVETRMLFAGNILYHPGYRNVKKRVPYPLKNTNVITEKTFFVGVYPGIDEAQLSYMIKAFNSFFTTLPKDS